ncbi:MAG: universal stress protein [Actinomycetota bacterium]|nr:universal stress protein [Actinomycetota bacterium]
MVHSEGRIVVGVDGSPESLEAIRWSARQAELTGCQLEAVIAWDFPTPSPFEFGAEGRNIDWAQNARTVLDAAVTRILPPGTAITSSVIQGHPAEVLVSAAAGAQLLVVGSRGHGGFAGMLLGSVSDYVIAHATCPVTVIRHGPPGKEK